MIRSNFDEYTRATGALKSLWLEALVVENEALVQRCATEFLARTNYHIEPLRDDVFQAARIGLMQAIQRWEPMRASFSTAAYFWMRHEMQLVVRHASPVSRPKSADLPRRKQQEAARFFALTGREPTPGELGVTASAVVRAQKAAARFVPVREAELEPTEVPDTEGALDRKRDTESLQAFLTTRLSVKQRAAFWAGDEKLVAWAKRFIENRRKK